MIKNKIEQTKRKHEQLNEYIMNVNNQIPRVNVHCMYILSILIFIFTFIFIFITPLIVQPWKITAYHYVLIIVTAVFIVICRILSNIESYNPRLIHIIAMLFMVSLMILFTLLDTVAFPYAPAIFMVIFMVVSAVIFVVPYEAILTFQIVSIIFFTIMDRHYKEEQLIGSDCFGVVLGATVGSVIFFVVMRLRLLEYEQKMKFIVSSETDFLTQISNRATSREKIDSYLNEKEEQEACAMMILDVDRFKEVNDFLGHEKGDEVLIAVSDILKGIVSKNDIIGRFGGDEFVVFLKDIKSEAMIKNICGRIDKGMKSILAGKFSVSCSKGICFLKEGAVTREEMFRVADEALYEAKAVKKGGYAIQFFSKIREENRKSMVIITDEQQERDLLHMHFEYGYNIKTFEDTKNAEVFISRHAGEIQVVLLSCRTIDDSSLKFILHMKQNRMTESIPIIGLVPDEKTGAKYIETGAEDIALRPINPAIVKLRIRTYTQVRT